MPVLPGLQLCIYIVSHHCKTQIPLGSLVDSNCHNHSYIEQSFGEFQLYSVWSLKIDFVVLIYPSSLPVNVKLLLPRLYFELICIFGWVLWSDKVVIFHVFNHVSNITPMGVFLAHITCYCFHCLHKVVDRIY
jgi:hypothetical protein